MGYKVIFHPEAEREYADALDWYAEVNSELRQRFKTAILNQIELIINNPESYPIRKSRYRESKTEVFPFQIVYIVNQSAGVIYIAAIYHTSRNPRKKYRK